MVCEAYFGKLSGVEEIANEHPLIMLKDPIELVGKGWALLDNASNYFFEEKKIDWGSFLWKCSVEQVLKFLYDSKSNLEWLMERDEKNIQNVKRYCEKNGNIQYGILFIEIY